MNATYGNLLARAAVELWSEAGKTVYTSEHSEAQKAHASWELLNFITRQNGRGDCREAGLRIEDTPPMNPLG